MSPLRLNVLFNVLGQGWAVAVNLLCVPIFVLHFGAEGYGLIALLPLLTALYNVLDGGLALTLNREMARLSATDPARLRPAAATLQAAHLAIGVALGCVVLVTLPLVGTGWLTSSLDEEGLAHSLQLIALVLAFQWPVPFIQNGLLGLGRQGLANFLFASHATLVNVGGVGLVLVRGAGPEEFLQWAVFCAALHSASGLVTLWRVLPATADHSILEWAKIRSVARFSGGVAGVGLSGAVLGHADRIIGSFVLSLDQFGYYSLGATVGRSIHMLIAPVHSAVFPRFSRVAASGRPSEIKPFYGLATQLMCVAVLPPAMVIYWFGDRVALAWLGAAASSVSSIAAVAGLLALGSAINGLMHMPFGMQLAHGITHLGFAINLALLVMAVPAAIMLHDWFGVAGLAGTWVLINAAYFALGIPITHARLPLGSASDWFVQNLLACLITVSLVCAVLHVALGPPSSRVDAIAAVLFALVLAYAAAVASTPRVRNAALAMVHATFRR